MSKKAAMEYRTKGNFLVKLKKFHEAIEWFNKSIEEDPSFAMAWFSKGNTLEKLEKYEEALECIKKVIKLDPSNRMAQTKKVELSNIMANVKNRINLMEEGKKAFSQGKYKEALDMLWHTCDAENCEVWFYKGISYYELGKYEKAFEYFDIALKYDTADRNTLSDMGLILYNNDLYGYAVNYFDKILFGRLKITENDIEQLKNQLSYDTINELKIMIGREELTSFFRLLQLDEKETIVLLNHFYIPKEEDAPIWNLRGLSMKAIGQKEEADYSLKKSTEINSSYIFKDEDEEKYKTLWKEEKNNIIKDLIEKAQGFMNEGKYFHATTCYNKAIKVDGENPGLLRMKYTSAKRSRNYFEALKCCDKILETNSGDIEAWLDKASIFKSLAVHCDFHKIFDKEYIDKGLFCHDRAIELEPDNRELLDLKGNFYLYFDMIDEAISCYKNVFLF